MRKLYKRGCVSLKKFLKGRWFPLTVAIIIALAVGVVLFFCGFRITYSPELENSWDAISAVATWVGAIGTIVVLWYNHRSISLTQRSVQQAINLQLYEKRLELYTALSRNDAFKDTPLEVKIVYSDIIYSLYKKISDLCSRKASLMDELYILTSFADGRAEPCWNVGEEQFEKYLRQLDLLVKGCDACQKESLMKHKKESQDIQTEIQKSYRFLEKSMRMILNDSIGKDASWHIDQH